MSMSVGTSRRGSRARKPSLDPEWLAQLRREHYPCSLGLHVMGHLEDGDDVRCLTLANHQLPSAEITRRVWAEARLALEDKDGEVVVDLFVSPYTMEDNFLMRRQMMPRLAAIVETTRAD